MSYLESVNSQYVEDIIKRKEYLLTQSWDKPATAIDVMIGNAKRFQPRSYQTFAQNYMSPESNVKRVYVKYGTGTGKTPLAILVALPFIEIFKKQRELNVGQRAPSIVIIGFTKHIFKKEILKYPEFGYVNRDELAELERLKASADIGTKDDEKYYAEYLLSIRRRITNRKKSGFFQFYGYREFVNKIFSSTIDINSLSEKEIHEKITSGDLKLNLDLLEELKNSLVICDEIHNVYNSCDKNNWGIALQALFNYHKYNIRALFLSATPINHSPSEVVDLLNLLHIDKTFTKNEFFDINTVGECILLKNKESSALTTIGKHFAGKILFLEDANPKYFPTSALLGDKIKDIPILRFVRCQMSKYNYRTYKEVYTGTLAQDAQYIVDFALPNPEFPDISQGIGLYKTQETKNALQNASSEWLNKHQIAIIKDKFGLYITGDFLHQSTIGLYSAKYLRMIKDILLHIKNGDGKMFIYHKYVRMSGVLFIKEILLRNGILDEFSEPTDGTLDAISGLTRLEHTTKKITSQYTPVRFIIVHSEIDMSVREKSIEKYNSPNNATGNEIMILLGAEVIKESYDIKCVRHLMIMSRPDNISTLLQIFGRAKRQNSHIDLPPEKRTVTYQIYVSSIPQGLSYEEKKYKERIMDYQIVQKIERSMHIYAADSFINFPIIKNTFVNGDTLGILPFEPNYTPGGPVIESTYNAYYTDKEVNVIMYIIKRLFLEVSPVFILNDLIQIIRDPPFSLEINPKLLSTDNIQIAMMRLVLDNDGGYTMTPPESKKIAIDRLFDPNDKIIIYLGVEYVITVSGKLYILSPYIRDENMVDLHFESPWRLMVKLKDLTINVQDYLLDETDASYDIRKPHFHNKYEKATLVNMMDAICEYTISFHISFIEEIIQYLFNKIINRTGQGEMDAFYIKMLYYYDLHELILFYDTSKEYIRATYDFPCTNCTTVSSQIKSLESSLSHSGCHWCPDVSKVSFYQSVEIMTNAINNKKSINGSIVPLGYFIDTTPRFYHPDKGWYDAADYAKSCTKYIENDILIGYHQKTKTGLHVRFKIRSPIDDKVKLKDSRKIEKGSLCDTKSKTELISFTQKLGVSLDIKMNTSDICEEIRARLIYLELSERKKKSNIKYFYQYWECRPGQ